MHSINFCLIYLFISFTYALINFENSSLKSYLIAEKVISLFFTFLISIQACLGNELYQIQTQLLQSFIDPSELKNLLFQLNQFKFEIDNLHNHQTNDNIVFNHLSVRLRGYFKLSIKTEISVLKKKFPEFTLIFMIWHSLLNLLVLIHAPSMIVEFLKIILFL